MSSPATSDPVPAGPQSPDQDEPGLAVSTVVEIGFGFGFAVLGLIISFIVARTRHPRFYTDPRTSHGDHIEEELAAPEPEE